MKHTHLIEWAQDIVESRKPSFQELIQRAKRGDKDAAREVARLWYRHRQKEPSAFRDVRSTFKQLKHVPRDLTPTVQQHTILNALEHMLQKRLRAWKVLRAGENSLALRSPNRLDNIIMSVSTLGPYGAAIEAHMQGNLLGALIQAKTEARLKKYGDVDVYLSEHFGETIVELIVPRTQDTKRQIVTLLAALYKLAQITQEARREMQ